MLQEAFLIPLDLVNLPASHLNRHFLKFTCWNTEGLPYVTLLTSIPCQDNM